MARGQRWQRRTTDSWSRHEQENTRYHEQQEQQRVQKNYYRREERWQPVLSKKQKQQERRWAREEEERRNSTTYFVSNLPEGCSSTKLWKAFDFLENLGDAFVPNKRDGAGNFFGFIRLKRVTNGEEWLDLLNKVTIDGAKLGVNIARFNRDGSSVQKSHTGTSGRQQKKIDVNNGEKERHWDNRESKGDAGQSFSNIVTGDKQSVTSCKTIFVNPVTTEAAKTWEGTTLVGEVASWDILIRLEEFLSNENMLGAKTAYLGGMRVMLCFPDNQTAMEFLDGHKEFCSTWASKMEAREDGYNDYKRVAWLIIRGVPSALWDRGVFNTIGERFGRVVLPSEASKTDGCLSFEKLAIVVNHGARISEEACIVWKGHQFKIWVQEEEGEWTPNFVVWSSETSSAEDKSLMISPVKQVPMPEDVEKSQDSIEIVGDSGDSDNVHAEQKFQTAKVGCMHVEGTISKQSNDGAMDRVDPIYFFQARVNEQKTSGGPSESNMDPSCCQVGSKGHRPKISKSLGHYFDLNLRPDDPFDLDKIIWGRDQSISAKKRKTQTIISDTFIPELQKKKRVRFSETIFGEGETDPRDTSRTFKTQNVEGTAGYTRGKTPSKDPEVQKEVTATVEVGCGIGVGLEGFQKEVDSLVEGELVDDRDQ
ncbi:putative RNA recognition motif domain, nucleotide-binding alpha-beta plait domain superfamily [Helianthus annuus]|nr:putative RNA recognition motif domain, nucleotide-binding alpha-beta plait domain superfamily [Helianthus annuus]KAJ0499228.1 putative RNA recognition motif domain, nucleotide-binding alpha-beta plait domain superfamily [Helianthus annuus]KAJ0665244.1 putative RNA recognition motif domain, nucleotide-binding alpha-beta plait domain superfamily [Helianthus annuus]KAJ0860003.1 putative RNA recognition motif domain, nucleotide-binding alpha-beta plait domain superfamily [Helianthus annuus]